MSNSITDVLAAYGLRDFEIVFPDGSCIPAECEPIAFRLVVRDDQAAIDLFEGPLDELTAAEAFVDGRIEIEGDIGAAVRVVENFGNYQGATAETAHTARADATPIERQSILANGRGGATITAPPATDVSPSGVEHRVAHLDGEVHSVHRDRQAVSFHYDVANEFFALWLDDRMIYSCGYFQAADQDIDTAQRQKLDHICRKLRLTPGDRLLDIGCGWGGLIIHAAENYGVHAVGITLSEKQHELACRRIAAAGLADRCDARLCDYRELDCWGSFDKLVSVGMFEHVGRSQAQRYFDIAWRLLKPGGAFLNHAVADQTFGLFDNVPTFATSYIFPDGELQGLPETLAHAEQVGFEIRDVESLREHYWMTLNRWRERLEAHRAEAIGVVGQQTYRIWRLFLAGAARGFEVGRQNLFQTLLVKPDRGDSRLPLTRADWYAK